MRAHRIQKLVGREVRVTDKASKNYGLKGFVTRNIGAETLMVRFSLPGTLLCGSIPLKRTQVSEVV